MDPTQELKNQVNAYLTRQMNRLQLVTIDALMIEVRLWVPGATPVLISDKDLRSLIFGFYLVSGKIPAIRPLPSIADSQIVQSVKKAVTSVVEGIEIKHGDGKINIAVSGVTAELKKQDVTASVGISWGGTLSVQAQKGNFNFSGEISKDHWQMKLSYPEDTAVPDISQLGKIFGQGESAFRGIIKATASISDLKDVQRVAGQIKPYMQPVQDAVEAAQGIAKAPKSGVSFGITFGSPPAAPGQTGIPGGIQGTIGVTITF